MSNMTNPLTALAPLLARAASDSLSPSEAAALALALAQVQADASKALEPLKKQLRSHARDILKGEARARGKVAVPVDLSLLSFLGLSSGTCGVTVNFGEKRPRFRKNMDPEDLLDELGDDSFDELFDVRVSYLPKKDLPSRLAQAVQEGRQEEVASVLTYLEDVEPTPRVSFALPRK